MAATLHTAAYTLPAVDFTHIEAAAARTLKNVALFAAAPFIGLLYAVALPFVGLAMLAWIGGRALVRTPAALRALRNVALFVAAPFIGLVYALALPFAGIALIAKAGYDAYRAPVAA